jgi:hypothetical protein
MSAQKRLSQLSFAAIALLVVALPAFAQTDSISSAAEKASPIDATEIVALNGRLVSGLRSEVKRMFETPVNENLPSFSAAKFMQAVSELPNATPTASSLKMTTFELIPAPKFEKKDAGSSRNGITFVPSRGQKLPGQLY